MFRKAGLKIWKFMTMVNHSRFLHYVLLLVFEIGRIVSEAESVTFHTWNGKKGSRFFHIQRIVHRDIFL